jgi:cation diffusion facilitator family transporter
MSTPPDALRLAVRIAIAGIVSSAALSALNVVVGLTSHSTAVVAIGVEFAGDVLASSAVLFGMVAAARPADDEHPYGHGRLETVSASVVGMILVLGGAFVCWNSLQAVGERHIPPAPLAIVALVIAIATRSVMAVAKFRIGRRVGSSALIADAWNDSVDILAGLAALTAVGLAMIDPTRFLAADHYGGFAVGVVVVVTGLRVFREASLELMDTMPSDERMAAVRAAAFEVGGVRGVEKARARKTGLRYHVDLHVEVDPLLTVADAHAIGGAVRSRIRTTVPWVDDVLVHIEPTRRVQELST